MLFERKKYSDKLLLSLYRDLVKTRLVEEKMLIELRKGSISKWFSSVGQEAISVGATEAMKRTEYVLTVHRNLGVFINRKVPLDRLFGQFMGKANGFTKGRDRSFHFGTLQHKIIGMISHLGAQLPVADGIALSHKLNKEKKVALVFTGEGGASEGDFHEAVNVAAVWKLPVIFIIENNGYGLSTPTKEQYGMNSFEEKGPAYGIESIKINGNNVLEVYQSVYDAARKMRRTPRPVIIEAVTFRMRGHEEASGTDYVPEELFKKWEKKDPIENYEKFLIQEKLLSKTSVKEIYHDIEKDIQKQLDKATAFPAVASTPTDELKDVYAPATNTPIIASNETETMRFIDAIKNGMQLSMRKHDNLIMMGQDIAEYGGVFKATEGLYEEFGGERVRNTPICESAIIGASFGFSLMGGKSIVEMQFADFISCGFNQVVNNLAKSHYRWQANADVVIRMPAGGGNSAGPFHSQSNEAWFFKTPGLKIVYPSTPSDAKGLFLAAIEDPNPVLFFEHKYLYRTTKEEVATNYYTYEIGKAKKVCEGNDMSIITYGWCVHWAKEIASEFTDISIEIIDLCSIMPWDKDTVVQSVKKTGKVIIVNEDTLTGSVSGEIASYIAEHCFEYLDAPIKRIGSIDTPIPFSSVLEDNFLGKKRLYHCIQELERY